MLQQFWKKTYFKKMTLFLVLKCKTMTSCCTKSEIGSSEFMIEIVKIYGMLVVTLKMEMIQKNYCNN